MITPGKIKKLKTYNNSSFEILSVYLGTDSVQSPSGELLLKQFHSLKHKGLNKKQRVAFESDIERIEKYLGEYIPLARSLIFFSAGKQLWETVELEFSLAPSLSVGVSPNTDPLIHALHNYSKYLVLLVDRKKARMFIVEQGEIVDQAELIDGHVPQKVKSTSNAISGGEADISFRYNEEMLQHHVDLVARAVAKFTKNNAIHFVIIGGHSEMFKKIIKSLPTSLQDKVLSTFVTEPNIPLNDVLLKSKKYLLQ